MLERLTRGGTSDSPPGEVGIAVGPDRVVAVTASRRLSGPAPDRVFRRSLDEGPDDGSWPALEEALAGLRGQLGGDGDTAVDAHVALLPPLGRTKGVRLPGADRASLRRLVAAEAQRHFLRAPDDPVADAVLLDGGGDGPVPALAACASGTVAEAVLASVRQAGFDPGLVAPAAYAAAEGARTLDAGLDDGQWVLELRSEGWRQDLRLEDGRLRAVAPAPPPAAAGSDASPAGAETAPGRDGPPETAGAGDDRDGAPEAGRRRLEDGDGPAGTTGPEALAAFGTLVQPEDGLVLLPDEARAGWTRRLRARAAALAAAAVALLMVAAGLHLWGLDRELAAVERARAAISERVSRASTTRDAAESLGALLTSVRDLRPERPRWTRVVAELADALPSSAYLDELSVTDRGILLTGSARSPSALIARLEDAPLFRDATLESVTRGSGGPDAFRIVVHLPGGDAPAATPEAPAGDPASASGAGPGTEAPRDPALARGDGR